MFQTRRISRVRVLQFAVATALPATLWGFVVFVLYAIVGLDFLRVPFLPVATIGTAVAFYVGFKNNASYDRFWEGRKIWGGVVNTSRSWAVAVLSYVDASGENPDTAATKRELVYRHLAWTNALRLQLRRSSRFFHQPSRGTKRRLDRHDDHMRNDWNTEIAPFLDPEELAEVTPKVNPATHLVATQGQQLAQLVEHGRLDMFRQIEMMALLTELYTLQGKCERIKNTPFPRQYAEYSRIFTRVFVFLVPLGMLDVFGDHIRQAQDLATTRDAWPYVVPMLLACTLVSWVFLTMEGIGDSSEDPFERSMNDVPMNALCIAIERDLRELLGETELPPKEVAVDGILY